MDTTRDERLREILQKMTGSTDKRFDMWDSDLHIFTDESSKTRFAIVEEKRFIEALTAIKKEYEKKDEIITRDRIELQNKELELFEKDKEIARLRKIIKNIVDDVGLPTEHYEMAIKALSTKG